MLLHSLLPLKNCAITCRSPLPRLLCAPLSPVVASAVADALTFATSTFRSVRSASNRGTDLRKSSVEPQRENRKGTVRGEPQTRHGEHLGAPRPNGGGLTTYCITLWPAVLLCCFQCPAGAVGRGLRVRTKKKKGWGQGTGGTRARWRAPLATSNMCSGNTFSAQKGACQCRFVISDSMRNTFSAQK